MAESPLPTRASGVLLHPTSLPGRGIGSLGEEAYRFVDWLVGAGQSYWQILPLVAVGDGGSPYNGLSALAGNPQLVSVEELVRAGLLDDSALRSAPPGAGPVDHWAVSTWKERVLGEAYDALVGGVDPDLAAEFATFRRRHAAWLNDYALYRAIRSRHDNASWTEWPAQFRDREPDELDRFRAEHGRELEREMFQQFLFDRQWLALRRYANERGVRILGDLPIFVAHDSADVWARRDLFRLDPDGHAEVVSGVPPDYFSETGQRWGNPLYRWDVMADRGYPWWRQRFWRTLEWVDIVRIDHFRGFRAYWEIPAAEQTAIEGRWRPGPGEALFEAVAKELGDVPVVAEDLGIITPDVEELRDALGFPGMRVLQFAFDGDPANPHLPENYVVNAVAYTGTHDNDTIRGWWEHASPEERKRVEERVSTAAGDLHWELMRLVFESPAQLAVVPLQDLLGLGSAARMNRPGTTESNWSWRFREGDLTPEIQSRLLAITRASRRAGEPADKPGTEETGP